MFTSRNPWLAFVLLAVGLAYATLPGHVNIGAGRVTLTAGHVDIGEQAPPTPPVRYVMYTDANNTTEQLTTPTLAQTAPWTLMFWVRHTLDFQTGPTPSSMFNLTPSGSSAGYFAQIYPMFGNYDLLWFDGGGWADTTFDLASVYDVDVQIVINMAADGGLEIWVAGVRVFAQQGVPLDLADAINLANQVQSGGFGPAAWHDLAVFSNVLDGATISNLWTGAMTLTTNTLGLVYWWPLDDGTGTTAREMMQGLDGTLSAGTTWTNR